MLDNMNDALLKKCIQLTRQEDKHIKLEASGNMDLERVKTLKNFGLDFISIGKLTHSVKGLDLSLKFNDIIS